LRRERMDTTLRIRVDKELYIALKLYAEKNGLDISKAARRLMRLGLERSVLCGGEGPAGGKHQR